MIRNQGNLGVFPGLTVGPLSADLSVPMLIRSSLGGVVRALPLARSGFTVLPRAFVRGGSGPK